MQETKLVLADVSLAVRKAQMSLHLRAAPLHPGQKTAQDWRTAMRAEFVLKKGSSTKSVYYYFRVPNNI